MVEKHFVLFFSQRQLKDVSFQKLLTLGRLTMGIPSSVYIQIYVVCSFFFLCLPQHAQNSSKYQACIPSLVV